MATNKKNSDRLNNTIAQYKLMLVELEKRRDISNGIRARIAELDAAIAETLAVVNANHSLTQMSITDIKELSNKKHLAQIELSHLNTAKEEIENGLRRADDVRDVQFGIYDTKNACWSALFTELTESVDMDRLKEIVTAGLMAGYGFTYLVNNMFGYGYIDADLANQLSERYGVPM